jgi:dienelactone hydrolase
MRPGQLPRLPARPPSRHGTGRPPSRPLVGLVGALLVLSGCGNGGNVQEQGRPVPPAPTETIIPPAQPTHGPGGSQRRHAGARRSEVGGALAAVEIFEPAQPTPARAPVVVFTQGVAAAAYQGWVDHLVRRGRIVVFQNQPFRRISLAQRRAGLVAGLRAALRELARPGHVRPQLDAIVVVGHSIGAVMAAQLAADTSSQGLPRPRAVFALQPPEVNEANLQLLGRIPPSALVLVLASDQDDRVGEAGAEALWAALAHLPPANRDYVRVRSDQRGPVRLWADHLLPLSSADNPPDALDWYGPWKLLDGLQRCATARQDCEYALGGTTQQRFMGRWSDGSPVLPLQVS